MYLFICRCNHWEAQSMSLLWCLMRCGWSNSDYRASSNRCNSIWRTARPRAFYFGRFETTSSPRLFSSASYSANTILPRSWCLSPAPYPSRSPSCLALRPWPSQVPSPLHHQAPVLRSPAVRRHRSRGATMSSSLRPLVLGRYHGMLYAELFQLHWHTTTHSEGCVL